MPARGSILTSTVVPTHVAQSRSLRRLTFDRKIGRETDRNPIPIANSSRGNESAEMQYEPRSTRRSTKVRKETATDKRGASLSTATSLLYITKTSCIMHQLPALIAFCCNGNVVETTGHPFPGPFKFCRVTEAALSLADLSPLESPVGKDTDTVGFLSAFPAWTLAINC